MSALYDGESKPWDEPLDNAEPAAIENALREQGVDTSKYCADNCTLCKFSPCKKYIDLPLVVAASTQADAQSSRRVPKPLELPPLDLAAAQIFLNCLGKGQPFTFQTFGDKNKQDRSLAKIHHGNIDEHGQELIRANSRGAGVFVMINRGDLKGRKAGSVQKIRAVFVDLDGAPLNPIWTAPLLPHMVIESSHEKYHAYWLVDDLPLEDFTTTQMSLARLFHGDPNVKDLPRVMRMPGFFHRKSTPFRTHILRILDTPPYSASELLNAFKIDLTVSTQAFSRTAQIDKGNRNNAMFQMATGFLVDGLPPNPVLTRLLAANKARCTPPLPEVEVIDIWERVCEHRPTNNALGTVVNNPALAHLSFPARWLYLIALVRATGSNDSFSLTLIDCAEHGFSRRQRQHALRELQDAGLLVQIRPHYGGVGGGSRQCALFTLGVEMTPNRMTLGVKTATVLMRQ